MEGVLTDDIMKDWGPHKYREADVMLFSMGSIYEGHGPALSPRNDDLVAQRTCMLISEKTGFPYVGHLPFASDRAGEIAKDWCPAWKEPEATTQGIIRFIRSYMAVWPRRISHVVVISGHGGNNFLKDHEERISKGLGKPFLYVLPYENVSVKDDEHGEVYVEHANSGEHSVAAFMGLLKREGLDDINKVASENPDNALEKWKPLCGLGWYVLHSGERYRDLRNPEYGLVKTAEGFRKERHILADPEIGRQLFEQNLESTLNQIREFISHN